MLPSWTTVFGFTLIIAILNKAITRIFKEKGREWKLSLGLCACLAIFHMKAQRFDYMTYISNIQVIVPQMIRSFVSSIFEGDIWGILSFNAPIIFGILAVSSYYTNLVRNFLENNGFFRSIVLQVCVASSTRHQPQHERARPHIQGLWRYFCFFLLSFRFNYFFSLLIFFSISGLLFKIWSAQYTYSPNWKCSTPAIIWFFVCVSLILW